MLVSWVVSVAVVVAIALMLTALGRPMAWFAHPLLIVPLYVFPSFLAMGEIHTQLVKRVRQVWHY